MKSFTVLLFVAAVLQISSQAPSEDVSKAIAELLKTVEDDVKTANAAIANSTTSYASKVKFLGETAVLQFQKSINNFKLQIKLEVEDARKKGKDIAKCEVDKNLASLDKGSQKSIDEFKHCANVARVDGERNVNRAEMKLKLQILKVITYQNEASNCKREACWNKLKQEVDAASATIPKDIAQIQKETNDNLEKDFQSFIKCTTDLNDNHKELDKIHNYVMSCLTK